MPTGFRLTELTETKEDSGGHEMTSTLRTREPATAAPGAAGYGYEIVVVAESGQEWPLHLLQWAVKAEIRYDVGLLSRVEEFDGMTVERLDAGLGEQVNVLIVRHPAAQRHHGSWCSP